LADRFGTLLSRQQAVACFRDDVARELPGIHALLEVLKSRFRLAVLSNTFFGHWDHFETTELYRRFEQPLASHLLGAAKPDSSAYILTLERLGARPEAVLFIDDKLENVQAARALGIHAVHSQSVDATRATLAELVGL